jgi:tetratricopeptide (TPR) repeat protein
MSTPVSLYLRSSFGRMNWMPPMSPSSLLRADQYLIDLVGAQTNALVGDLQEWANLDQGLSLPSLAVVSGAGGSGKSRIGVSLVSGFQLKSHVVTGFVGTRSSNFRDELNVGSLIEAERSLLILDYAETNPSMAIAVLELAAEATLAGGQHRVVFLVRSLTTTVSNWLNGLARLGVSATVEAAIGSLNHVQIDDLLKQEDLQSVYSHSVETFSAIVSPTRSIATETSRSIRDFGSPLDACAEGLCDALGADEEAVYEVDGRLRSAVERVVDHESRYLKALAERQEFQAVQRLRPERLVVAMSLSNYGSLEMLKEGLSTVTGFDGLDEVDQERSVEFLKTMYPGDLLPSALQPDRVLEAMSDVVFESDPGFVIRMLGTEVSSVACLVTLARIGPSGRCWSRELVTLVEANLPAILEKALRPDQQILSSALAEFVSRISPELSTEILAELSFLIPPQPALHASPLAAVIAFEYLQKELSDSDRAAACNVLAVRLWALGRFDEGIEPSQQAVDIRTRLVESEGVRFLPHLARSLSNHANLLAEVGRRVEAAELEEMAVGIRGRLAEVFGDRHLANHAASLLNYAVRLGELGREVEALELSQRAVEIYARLVEVDGDRHLPDFAKSLNNHAVVLAKLGLYVEALEPSQQAVDIRGRLVEMHGDRYLVNYASSLNNHALRLGELGRQDEALGPSQAALNTFSRLVEVHGDQYLSGQAKSLVNHANRLGELDRGVEALELTVQAADIYGRLVKDQGDRHLPDFSATLNNLAVRLGNMGRHAEAHHASQQAVNIRARLVELYGDRYLSEYSKSLNNLALQLAMLGRHVEALEPSQEALDIHGRLIEIRGDRFLADHATSLNNHADLLFELGREEEASVVRQRLAIVRTQLERIAVEFAVEASES